MKSPFERMRPMSSQTGAARAPTGFPYVQPRFSRVSSRAIIRVNNSLPEAADLQSGFQVAAGGIGVTEAMVDAQKTNIDLQFMALVKNKTSSACEEIMNIQIRSEYMSRTLGVTDG